MNPLLEQFLSEARDFLQSIGEDLMHLEQAPKDKELLVSLFRSVHTLKGNSGLFDFPEMTRVLHAGEDLMDAVRNGRLAFTQALADELLDAMDFVGMLCDEIETGGRIPAARAADSTRLAAVLRALLEQNALPDAQESSEALFTDAADALRNNPAQLPLGKLPEAVLLDAYQRAQQGQLLHWVSYQPIAECFFQGDDPLHAARQTPAILGVRIVPREAFGPLAALDAYHCVLEFQMLSAAPLEELLEHYRYVADQVRMVPVPAPYFVQPQGDPNGGPVYEDFVAEALLLLNAGKLSELRQAAQSLLHLSSPALVLSSALRWLLLVLETEPQNLMVLRTLVEFLRTLSPPDWSAAIQKAKAIAPVIATPAAHAPDAHAAVRALFAAQGHILRLEDQPGWLVGRLRSVAAVLIRCCRAMGDNEAEQEIASALARSLAQGDSAPLLTWLEAHQASVPAPASVEETASVASTADVEDLAPASQDAATEDNPVFGRRAEDSAGPKSLKVDQSKIDRLMNLIGEMVVSKNALPYLAQRAEEMYGVRELAREIKAQYAVINRIAEEMQDAIMQVRMLPVSFVFQRFPRLVRDISRKLGKEVELVLEGEETEADKNIIESLADPLIHIVRNSLDHGLETPEVRRAAGKPAAGKLTIRAVQEGDRVLIDIIDDGRGIDPQVIKRKAYEKGLIDEATLERISDRDAIHLVFAPGFSTVEVVSDLSGRGVGMDVVRTAVEKVNGSLTLESEVGRGTRLRISLPLSMAVTNVMIVESDGQIFGVPMDHVVETVRVPCASIHAIKQSQSIVLRGSIVPLKALNSLLELDRSAKPNADNEMAVLVVKIGNESVGLIVDDFHETAEILQKPLAGVLTGLSVYSGSALMGDGSVLMVLNVKELV